MIFKIFHLEKLEFYISKNVIIINRIINATQLLNYEIFIIKTNLFQYFQS